MYIITHERWIRKDCIQGKVNILKLKLKICPIMTVWSSEGDMNFCRNDTGYIDNTNGKI
jgi:hypothetical protein